jgi:hypothetical protein
MRRFAEGAAELPTEVRPREARRARHLVDPERLDIPSVGEVLGA